MARRYLGVMMRSAGLLWGNNRVEWIKEKKKDVHRHVLWWADLNLEYCIIVLTRFIILTN